MDAEVISEKVQTFFIKYLSWFLIPIGILYGLDFLKLMLTLVEMLVSLLVATQVMSFLFGAGLAMWSLYPEKDYSFAFTVRGAKYLPMFRWGFEFTKWLMEDIVKVPEEKIPVAKVKKPVKEEVEFDE
jgi:hypothetical protein